MSTTNEKKPRKRRNAHLSGFTFPEVKEAVDEIAAEQGMTISEMLHRVCQRIVRTGKIPL